MVLALLVGTRASADDRLEASGFTGLAYFGEHTQLGNSWAPEQIPGTAPMLGGRLTYVALPRLWEGDTLSLQLAGESELAFDASFTGSVGGGRMSYFAPVFAYRAQAMLRLAGVPYVEPHLLVGAGAETVSSSSPFMARDTDGEVFWGAGVRVPVRDRLHLRIDFRHGIMPARGGGDTSTFELQFGVATTFGLPRRVHGATAEVATVGAVDDADTDGDGIPDRLDRCPKEPETVNGIEDADGCPEADPDGDGIVGAADKCPDQAEDFDHFQDEDGCPDDDNDGDGIPDKTDKCPNEPETFNGFDDDDGCPDQVPGDVTSALAVVADVRFGPGSARVLEAAKTIVAPVVVMLNAHTGLRVVLVAHPDSEKTVELARRRAEALKWYLVDQGVAQDRLDTTVGAVKAPKGAPIEASLVVMPH